MRGAPGVTRVSCTLFIVGRVTDVRRKTSDAGRRKISRRRGGGGSALGARSEIFKNLSRFLEEKKEKDKNVLPRTLARKMADAAGSSSSARWSRTSLTSSTMFAGLSWLWATPVATSERRSNKSFNESSILFPSNCCYVMYRGGGGGGCLLLPQKKRKKRKRCSRCEETVTVSSFAFFVATTNERAVLSGSERAQYKLHLTTPNCDDGRAHESVCERMRGSFLFPVVVFPHLRKCDTVGFPPPRPARPDPRVHPVQKSIHVELKPLVATAEKNKTYCTFEGTNVGKHPSPPVGWDYYDKFSCQPRDSPKKKKNNEIKPERGRGGEITKRSDATRTVSRVAESAIKSFDRCNLNLRRGVPLNS